MRCPICKKKLEGLLQIQSSEDYFLFFGKCRFCGNLVYVERVKVLRKDKETWKNIYYVGVRAVDKRLYAYQKGLAYFFGRGLFNLQYDEERNLVIIPVSVLKRMVNAYGTDKFKDFEWVLFTIGGADKEDVIRLLLDYIRYHGSEDSEEEE